MNLVNIILPSPECDKSVATGGNISAVLKSSDPRLNRDLTIGQFLVAFSVYRDVICAVYPERRCELDAHMTMICDLNLKNGEGIFYQYHKAFSSKAALYITQTNIRLDWSVVDTELMVMITGGVQTISCNTWKSRTRCLLLPLSTVSEPRGLL